GGQLHGGAAVRGGLGEGGPVAGAGVHDASPAVSSTLWAVVLAVCLAMVLVASSAVMGRGMTLSPSAENGSANRRAGPCRNAAAPPSPVGGGAGSVSSPAARIPLMVR